MDSSVFKQYYKDIKAALEEQQLNRALSLEENLLYTNPSWPFLDEVISIRQAYQGLLGCMENGFRDDNRKDSFHHLLSRAYKLLHLLRRYYYKEQPKSLYSKSCLSVRRESYLAYQTILEKTTEIREEQNNKDVLRTILLTREHACKIFSCKSGLQVLSLNLTLKNYTTCFIRRTSEKMIGFSVSLPYSFSKVYAPMQEFYQSLSDSVQQKISR